MVVDQCSELDDLIAPCKGRGSSARTSRFAASFLVLRSLFVECGRERQHVFIGLLEPCGETINIRQSQYILFREHFECPEGRQGGVAAAAGNGATVAIELDVAMRALTGSMSTLLAADSNAREIDYLAHAVVGTERHVPADALSGNSSYCR
jgi:hypothetical protein